MGKAGDGKFYKRKKDRKVFLYLSTKVTEDSAWHFSDDENVAVEILPDGSLLVKKKEGE
jgi:hypothetical protein